MTERTFREDEIALIYSPSDGLRVEMPKGEMPIGIEGALLAGVFIRLQHDGGWANELKRWVMAEVPGLTVQ
jgi:hypothetical protein